MPTMQHSLSTMKIFFSQRLSSQPSSSEIVISEELRIDNYDESNLRTFVEHVCPQDMTSDDDIKATKKNSYNKRTLPRG